MLKQLKNRIGKGLVTLILGSFTAKIVTISIVPVLTRIYNPEDFGILAIFGASVTIIAPLLTLRYILAVPLAKSNRRANNLQLLSILILAFMSVILFILMLIASFIFYAIELEPNFFMNYWWTVVIGAMATAFYEVLLMSAMRRRDYANMNKSQLSQAISGAIVKLLGGFLGLGGQGLIVGQIFQQAGGVANIFRPFRQSMLSATNEFKFKYLVKLIFKYSDFAKYRMPAHLLYVYAAQAPLILSSYFWGSAETGQLSLALLVISLPVTIIGQNSSRVYYAEIAVTKTKEELKRITNYFSIALFIAGTTLGGGLLILSPFLSEIIFGEKWRMAEDLTRAMAITIPFQLVASTLINAYNIYGDFRKLLLTHWFRAVLVTLVFLICAENNLTINESILIYSMVVSLHYSAIWMGVRNIIINNERVKI